MILDPSARALGSVTAISMKKCSLGEEEQDKDWKKRAKENVHFTGCPKNWVWEWGLVTVIWTAIERPAGVTSNPVKNRMP